MRQRAEQPSGLSLGSTYAPSAKASAFPFAKSLIDNSFRHFRAPFVSWLAMSAPGRARWDRFRCPLPYAELAVVLRQLRRRRAAVLSQCKGFRFLPALDRRHAGGQARSIAVRKGTGEVSAPCGSGREENGVTVRDHTWRAVCVGSERAELGRAGRLMPRHRLAPSRRTGVRARCSSVGVARVWGNDVTGGTRGFSSVLATHRSTNSAAPQEQKGGGCFDPHKGA